MSASILADSILAGSGGVFLARIRNSSGSYLTQATTTSIACTVYDITSGTAVSSSTPTVTVATCVFDTIQTGSQWTKDSTGYNFRHAMPAATFATAGKLYQVSYVVTPSSGEAFEFRYVVTAK